MKADKFIVAASTLSDQQPHGPEVARDANCDTRPRTGGPKAPVGQIVKLSQFEAEQQLENTVNRDTFVLPTHFSPTTQADGER